MSQLIEIISSKLFLNITFIQSKLILAFWNQTFPNGSYEKRKQKKLWENESCENINQVYFDISLIWLFYIATHLYPGTSIFRKMEVILIELQFRKVFREKSLKILQATIYFSDMLFFPTLCYSDTLNTLFR